MKKLVLLMLVGVSLAGCDSMTQKFGEEVRQVEIGDSILSDGYNSVVYQRQGDEAMLDFDNNDPELSVNITDVESGSVFKVSLGSECATFPLPKGQRLLARFDMSKSKAKPQDIYMAPQTAPLYTMFCS